LLGKNCGGFLPSRASTTLKVITIREDIGKALLRHKNKPDSICSISQGTSNTGISHTIAITYVNTTLWNDIVTEPTLHISSFILSGRE
jgi:hypothetical protein